MRVLLQRNTRTFLLCSTQFNRSRVTDGHICSFPIHHVLKYCRSGNHYRYYKFYVYVYIYIHIHICHIFIYTYVCYKLSPSNIYKRTNCKIAARVRQLSQKTLNNFASSINSIESPNVKPIKNSKREDEEERTLNESTTKEYGS